MRTIGSVEPNYGRVLRVVNLEFNGTDVTTKFFYNNWNHIVDELDKYVMDSPCGKFIYIPAENNFLINCSTMDAIPLPSNVCSAATFIGNAFSANKLLIIYCNAINIVNIDNFITTRIEFTEPTVKWAELDTNNNLIITYTDNNHGLATKGRFDFRTQEIVDPVIEAELINHAQATI